MNKNKKSRRLLRFLPGIVLLTVLAAGVSVTAARYVSRKEQSGIIAPQQFYFTSDLLKEEAEDVKYYIDPDRANFTVQLFNYADAQRITQTEIPYEIEVTNGSASPESGKLSAGSQTTAEITVTPVKNDQVTTVTVKSMSPYEKTLKAVFEKGLGNQYTVEDHEGNAAAVLTMICADSSRDIKIQILSDQITVNQADDRVKLNGSEFIYTSPGLGVYSLILLKSDTSLNLTAGGQFADSITIGGISE